MAGNPFLMLENGCSLPFIVTSSVHFLSVKQSVIFLRSPLLPLMHIHGRVVDHLPLWPGHVGTPGAQAGAAAAAADLEAHDAAAAGVDGASAAAAAVVAAAAAAALVVGGDHGLGAVGLDETVGLRHFLNEKRIH